jgi:hypothetical protein
MTTILYGARNPRHKKALKKLRKVDCVEKITRLALDGLTQPEIAKQTGVSPRSVARYVAQFRIDCLAKSEANNSELVALALARYEDIYREAMAGWYRSQQNKEIKYEEVNGNDAPKFNLDGTPCENAEKSRKKRSRRTEGQCGEAAFLEKALNAIGKICELKGLNAPKQTEIDVHSTEIVSTHIVVQEVMSELHSQPGFVEYARRQLLADSDAGDICPPYIGGEVETGETPTLLGSTSDAVHPGESGGDDERPDNDCGNAGQTRQECIPESIPARVV